MSEIDRRARKAASNRAHHARRKAEQDQVLLRLQKGDRLALDAAAGVAGLSRTAFAQLYLIPFARALSEERLAKLAALGASQRLGLAAIFCRLVDQAKTGAPAEAPSSALSEEFDDLFGSGP